LLPKICAHAQPRPTCQLAHDYMSSPPPTKKIHLIRHAEAEHNVAWKLYGDVIWNDPHYTNPVLTDEGNRQAHALKRFQELYQVDKIFVSPSQRTLETAAILYDIGPIHGDDRLLEYGPGRIVNRRDPHHLLADEWPTLDLSGVSSAAVPIDTEESDEVFEGRLKSIIDQIINDDRLSSVAFVTHHDAIHRIWNLYSSAPWPFIKNGQYLTLEL